MPKNIKIFLLRIYCSFNFSGLYFNQLLPPQFGGGSLLPPHATILGLEAHGRLSRHRNTIPNHCYEHQELQVLGTPLLGEGMGRVESSSQHRGHTLRPGLAIRRVLSLRYAV